MRSEAVTRVHRAGLFAGARGLEISLLYLSVEHGASTTLLASEWFECVQARANAERREGLSDLHFQSSVERDTRMGLFEDVDNGLEVMTGDDDRESSLNAGINVRSLRGRTPLG